MYLPHTPQASLQYVLITFDRRLDLIPFLHLPDVTWLHFFQHEPLVFHLAQVTVHFFQYPEG